jgi:F420-non-reducing hydrogenase iron-sulfur subunit
MLYVNDGENTMSETIHSEILVFICHQCIPAGSKLARQWTEDGVHVRTLELPCSGKTDAQYLFHSIEGGARGFLVVTCPKGECHLIQGNYRAEIRVKTVQRLLSEIGLEPDRAVLFHCGPQDDLEDMIRTEVKKLCALSGSPLSAAQQTA